MKIDDEKRKMIKVALLAKTTALGPARRVLATELFREAMKAVRDGLIEDGMLPASAAAVATALMGAEFYLMAHVVGANPEATIAVQDAGAEIGRTLDADREETCPVNEEPDAGTFPQAPGRA